MYKNWEELILDESKKNYWQELMDFIKQEDDKYDIFPLESCRFKALNYTPIDKVKVVILGQDPYHGINQSMGLAFSVMRNAPLPPSLKNIFKELNDDLGISVTHGDLTKWAQNGVLLLNTILTVRSNEPLSHQKKGWEQFTDAIIKTINKIDRPIVFILWGKKAERKRILLDNPKHHLIISAHPSPLSARLGFFGSKPFSKTNAFLGSDAIDWSIND